MEYICRKKNNRKIAVYKSETKIGYITYSKWSYTKSIIYLSNSHVLTTVSRGFWKRHIDIKQGEKTWLTYSMSLKGGLQISSYLGAKDSRYTLKQKNVFSSVYHFLDEKDQKLLVIKSSFKWRKFNYQYTIISSDAFESLEQKDALLLMVINMVKYHQSAVAAAAAAV